jgi:hyperpolarization activated cyclic nucleotide-gated potassium channel 2
MAGNNADEIILNPKEIARNYLRSWFVLDLISSLPLDYVITLLYPDTPSVNHILHAGRSCQSLRDCVRSV